MDKTKTSISFELLKKVSIYHDEEIIIIDRIKKSILLIFLQLKQNPLLHCFV